MLTKFSLCYRFSLFLIFGGLVFTIPSRAGDPAPTTDIVLIGTGIMSATLGTLLKQLDPNAKIEIFERLPKLAAESSDGMNNAGTGHSGLAELNYTPEKALEVMEAFEVSKQFWAYLVGQGILGNPKEFIHPVPHLSWVHGEENVQFLRKRYAILRQIPLFSGMEYTEDADKMKTWIPAMMQGRDPAEPVAATRSTLGTDIDFGHLARAMLKYLTTQPGVTVSLSHEVRDLLQLPDGSWKLKIWDVANQSFKEIHTKFVFIGAGGGALPLLQRSGIPEARGYGGFPISGQFLVSKTPLIAHSQNAKVYGRAAVGSPPMSVPHLDTRIINGERFLIFGPFAGATTKFLKYGSPLDLFRSLRLDNLPAMLKAGYENLPLVGYLLNQLSLSPSNRMEALREFFPHAKAEDWELISAGQRVQIIKDKNDENGVLHFGTEVITSADGSLTAFAGASPGASNGTNEMLKVLQRSFPDSLATPAWQQKLREMIPSFGQRLSENPELAKKIRSHSHKVLQLFPILYPEIKAQSCEAQASG